MLQRPLKIALVAGEASGDILGAGLIQAIKRLYPNVEFTGIAGPKMQTAGCQTLFPMEKLSVMGLVEVIGRLRELLAVRKALYRHWKTQKPDIYIGIDSPDFNLPLACKLKQLDILTVHYVSPTVWAWRKKRIHKIARAINLMLTLFPFEVPIYEQHKIPVRFVGHPMADALADQVNYQSARAALGLAAEGEIITLLPGSRLSEIHQLAPIFIRTALYCLEENPYLHFIAPMANNACRAAFTHHLQKLAPNLPITLLDGQSQVAMAAANVVLLASGTATLEAMLLKRPMVVAYRMAPLTYKIMRRMVKTKYIALPNILAEQALVPEYIQQAAAPENLAKAIQDQLINPDLQQPILDEFQKIHDILRCGANNQAAKAVLELIESHSRG